MSYNISMRKAPGPPFAVQLAASSLASTVKPWVGGRWMAGGWLGEDGQNDC